ncbi:phosphatidylinositol/phosphatidylcholine transfer protein SFH4 [Gastrolobium bilobum]|uniref:phosphatidylinositol/phosphatidylcholine transfer protein SFH4 n=1 Tax=Gastrolobium bilobum TaxID=150636 RepID=UPI002AB182A6|nr:phosphatidylinositol/phosphatidylcholine transfer protein SFH4 [Gastrolobium bilobum]
MGDTVDYSDLSKNPKPGSVMTGKKAYRCSLIASRPKCFAKRNHERLVSLIHGGFGSSSVGRFTFFLLKVAALEILRRFSKRRCPSVWRGLQALQILCYPPFQWIQRWAPFKGLVKSMQVLSRPLLALTIGTVFCDQSEGSDGTSDCITDSHNSVANLELSPVQTDMNTSQCLTDPKILESENWLTQLNQELENQGIRLPERINDDELRRFYTASNNDFSCLLTSIKKTIHWRETYRILSEEELTMWSKMVFWHGYDVRHRPCLIVRLGLACNTLTSEDRPRFAQAVISQVDYGVLYLVDEDNPQITVLVDCEGLSPLKIPMQMMRSCASLLQDHFPNHLGCLFVIRLPAAVHVIAQTFIEVLKPATRNKMKIEGEMYQKVLSDYLPTLPSYLGGCCTCIICSEIGEWDMPQPYATWTSRRDGEGDISDNDVSPSLHPTDELEGRLCGNYDQLLRTAIVGILIFWVLIALGAVIFDPGSRYLPS